MQCVRACVSTVRELAAGSVHRSHTSSRTKLVCTHLVLSRPPSSLARTRQDFGKSLRHISFSWREVNYDEHGDSVGAQGCAYGPSPLFKGEFTLPWEQQEVLLSPHAPPIAPYRPIVLYAKLCDTVCSESACGNKMSHAGGYRCVWCDRAHCAGRACSSIRPPQHPEPVRRPASRREPQQHTK